jgi:hypothetical protein
MFTVISAINDNWDDQFDFVVQQYAYYDAIIELLVNSYFDKRH